MNCIIIDDQIDSIDVIADYISKMNQLKLVATFTQPLEGLSYLNENKVDLVFIDVEMPYLSGIDFIEKVRLTKDIHSPIFILITAFQNYAYSGFEQGVNDYLLKPVSFKRFLLAIERILPKINSSHEVKMINSKNINFIFVEQNGEKIKVLLSEIAYIEGTGNYITIYGNNLKMLNYKTMNAIQEELKRGGFLRVHKSFIVSLNHIEIVKPNEIQLKILNERKLIPIGKTYKNQISSILRI